MYSVCVLGGEGGGEGRGVMLVLRLQELFVYVYVCKPDITIYNRYCVNACHGIIFTCRQ